MGHHPSIAVVLMYVQFWFAGQAEKFAKTFESVRRRVPRIGENVSASVTIRVVRARDIHCCA